MKFAIALACLPLLACGQKPLVTPDALMDDINMGAIKLTEKRLNHLAYSYYQHNRVFGGQAHKDTIMYIYNKVYNSNGYNVYLEPQFHTWSDSNQTLSVSGRDYVVGGATYGPNGNVTARLVKVNDLGCFAENFPPAVKGKIALIERGNCTFSDKVALAGNAGAAAAIIYNNVPGQISGTLGSKTNPLGPYVPIVFATKSAGNKFAALLAKGVKVTGNVYNHAVSERRLTYNIIAETKLGDHDNVIALGAHTDSVNEGPGINDDGSGSTGILEVARELAKYNVTNAVRFCWWTAEEFGLLGSTTYVKRLAKEEKDKIRLFLDFDMIASPNWVYSIYDGDGSKFNMSGPPGSAQIEALFEKYYDDRGIPHIPTAFDGRSDYQAFIENDIPAGGIFTGAEEIKTKRQAKLFGGTAGIAFDPNYHGPGDNYTNLAFEPFEINTKAIAYAVATYARDLSSIPKRGTGSTKREVAPAVEKREEEEGVRMPCNKHLCPVYA